MPQQAMHRCTRGVDEHAMLRCVPTSSTRLRESARRTARTSSCVGGCFGWPSSVAVRSVDEARPCAAAHDASSWVEQDRAPLHAMCRRRRASLRVDVVGATRRGGAHVEASRRLLGLAVELRLTNDGLSSFSRECGVDAARTRRAARTENTRLNPHSTTKTLHFCFHRNLKLQCALFVRGDGERRRTRGSTRRRIGSSLAARAHQLHR